MITDQQIEWLRARALMGAKVVGVCIAVALPALWLNDAYPFPTLVVFALAAATASAVFGALFSLLFFCKKIAPRLGGVSGGSVLRSHFRKYLGWSCAICFWLAACWVFQMSRHCCYEYVINDLGYLLLLLAFWVGLVVGAVVVECKMKSQ